MRLALLAFTLLLAVPIASAQVAPPTPAPEARGQSTALAGVGGGLAGFAAGAYSGYVVGDALDPTRELIVSDGGIYGFAAGSALGTALGVAGGRRLAGDRDASFLGALGGAVVGQALAWGATYLAYEAGGSGARDVMSLSIPVATVVGATIGADR